MNPHQLIIVLLCICITLNVADASEKMAKTSPWLFGQNHWMADGDEDRTGYLAQLWPKVGESGVQLVRIGGNGYERKFPNRDKLNAKIDNIKSINAEPMLQIPRFFSALQAKELVEYYSSGSRRDVKFWSIGNEPMLHKEETLDEIYEYILRLGTAMKEVNPNITLFIYDEAYLMLPEYTALVGGSKDVTGIKVKGKWLVDGITFHTYPNGEEFTREDVIFSGPQKTVNDIKSLTTLIDSANGKHKRLGKDALLWGLTEVNVTWSNPNREISGYGNPSFLGGQFIAEIFGLGMQYGAFTIAPWCINETDAVKTDFGFIGMPAEFFPRSSYYHMQLMSQHMQGRFIHSESSEPHLKSIATKTDKGIALMLLNQHLDKTYTAVIDFGPGTSENQDHAKIKVDLALKKRNLITTITPQTTRLLLFSKKGKLKSSYKYDLGLNLKNAPPEQEKK